MSFLFLRNALLVPARRIVPKYRYKSVISRLPLLAKRSLSTSSITNILPKLSLVQKCHPRRQSSAGVRASVGENNAGEGFIQSFQDFEFFKSSAEEISQIKIDLELNLPEINYD